MFFSVKNFSTNFFCFLTLSLLWFFFFFSLTFFSDKKDWCVSIVKANREADKELIAAFTQQIFSQDQSACPYQEFMDVVFRQDVASYKRLLDRGCRLDRKETWGNVSAVIGGDWS